MLMLGDRRRRLLARANVRRWPFYAAGEASDYDGQVKTHEDRKDNGADKEIDGEAAIKLYDKSQEPCRSLLCKRHAKRLAGSYCLAGTERARKYLISIAVSRERLLRSLCLRPVCCRR